MKTEEEIRDKLAWLIGQRGNHQGMKLDMLNHEIRRLQWILGEGPDVVLVPDPNTRRFRFP